MTFTRTALFGAALALPFTTLSVITAPTPADAAPTLITKQQTERVHLVRHKSCGTYMYSKGGKCVDARFNPVKK